MKNQEQGRHSDKKWTKYVQKKSPIQQLPKSADRYEGTSWS